MATDSEFERSHERLVDVFEVVERRDGAVYRTRRLGLAWKLMSETAPENEVWAAVSSRDLPDDNPIGIRRKR